MPIPKSAEFMRRIGREKGGRPKGLKNKKTLLAEEALKEYKERIIQSMNKIFQSQLTIAQGINQLWKIEKKVVGKGKNQRIEKSRPILVTSESEIEEYLTGLIDSGNINDKEDTYYMITTKEPNNSAIDSMLDRTFGRPTQALVTKDPEGKDAPITSINVLPLGNDGKN